MYRIAQNKPPPKSSLNRFTTANEAERCY